MHRRSRRSECGSIAVEGVDVGSFGGLKTSLQVMMYVDPVRSDRALRGLIVSVFFVAVFVGRLKLNFGLFNYVREKKTRHL